MIQLHVYNNWSIGGGRIQNPIVYTAHFRCVYIYSYSVVVHVTFCILQHNVIDSKTMLTPLVDSQTLSISPSFCIIFHCMEPVWKQFTSAVYMHTLLESKWCIKTCILHFTPTLIFPTLQLNYITAKTKQEL